MAAESLFRGRKNGGRIRLKKEEEGFGESESGGREIMSEDARLKIYNKK